MSKETECKLETLINTGKGKYTDIEKEKIDHPHPLKLSNKNIGNFTCSNITLHSQKKDNPENQTVYIQDLGEVDRFIIYDYENGKYKNCLKYYKCTDTRCEYNLCLECYSKVYQCKNNVTTGCVKVTPIMFSSLTGVEEIISKVSELYKRFESNNNKYIQGKDDTYLWYDFTETSSYFREAGDKLPYKCEECNHLYSSLIPRFINKSLDKAQDTTNIEKTYLCPYCTVDNIKNNVVDKIGRKITYCKIIYTFIQPTEDKDYYYYNCTMCNVSYNTRDGRFINVDKSINLCIPCIIKIINFYRNLPENLSNGSALYKKTCENESSIDNCSICKRNYNKMFGSYINKNKNICLKCSQKIKDRQTVSDQVSDILKGTKKPNLKDTSYTGVQASFRKTSKKSRKRSVKRSRKRSVKRSRKGSVKRSLKKKVFKPK